MKAIASEIQFSILSADDIRNMSVIEITSTKLTGDNSLSDVRLGMSVADPETKCVTCKQANNLCAGHFGHINLNYPIFHPLYEKEIVKLLRVFCYKCFRFTKITSAARYIHFDKLSKVTEKKHVCPFCGTRQPTWMYSNNLVTIRMTFEGAGAVDTTLECSSRDIAIMLANFNKADLEQIGVTSWPENMVITTLPILPPCSRPSITTDDKIHDDHLTIQYLEIIKANNHICAEDPIEPQMKAIKTLIFRITTLFNNSAGKSKYSTTGKVIQGFKERLCGKKGVLRENLMGKRVEQSGRTVIGSEPTLLINQVAVPQGMADILTYRERVSIYNYERLAAMLGRGLVAYVHRAATTVDTRFAADLELQVGDFIDRHLMDGDMVLINRQPTLHTGSMIAFNTVIHSGKTLCFNLSNTKTFNADFDGDEMNIHVPQSPSSVCELAEISSIENHLLSQRNGKANIVLVQDNILALYLMTTEKDLISRAQLNDIAMFLVDAAGRPLTIPAIIGAIARVSELGPAESGRGVISLCFPGDFFYRDEKSGVRIERGIFAEGACTKDVMNHLIQVLYHAYNAHICAQVINNLQIISNHWLSLRGFSIGLEDCFLRDADSYDMVKEATMRCFIEAEAISNRIHHAKIKEIRIQETLNRARDIGMKIATEGFREGNNFVRTVSSGSKGDFFNIAQISGLLGQQYLKGARVEPTLNNGARSLYHYPFEISEPKYEYESRGFVRHSFLRGLSPREMFFHAVVGRSGVVDTAMGTSETGYMQRKIVKLMEDIHVANDQTVRDDTGLIYQFSYGGGFDVVHSPSMDILDTIAAKLNHNFEQLD